MNAKFEDIMARFDFDTCHAYMVLTNWTWAPLGNKVPTVEEMKSHVISMFYAMSKTRTHSRCGSGGFSIRYYTWDSSEELELSFDICRTNA